MGCGRLTSSSGDDDSMRLVHFTSMNASQNGGRLSDGRGSTMCQTLIRFTRKSEVVDYYERDPVRPSTNREMTSAYERMSLCVTTEDWLEPRADSSPPNRGLRLEYVYGYPVYASSANLFYTANPDIIIYPCSAILVLLNKSSNTQQFLGAGELCEACGHSDDILCAAISQKRDLIATGDVGTDPLICIWKLTGEKCPAKTIRQGEESVGVGRLAFSGDGRYLLAVDISRHQKIRIYDWRQDCPLLQTYSTSRGRILQCSWNLKTAVFCTVDPVLFWTKGASGFVKESGMYTEGMPTTPMNVVGWFSNGNCLTGGLNGCLYLWAERRTIKVTQVLGKDMQIVALTIVKDMIVTGGFDNVIHVLNAAMQHISQVDVIAYPRSLDWNSGTILCGTRDGVIQEFNGQLRSVLMEAHSEGEAWGLALHPKDRQIFVSTGDDNKIKCWDMSQRRCVSTGLIETGLSSGDEYVFDIILPRNQQSRAVAIGGNGHVAVGHNDGHVTVRMGLSQLNNIIAVLTDPQDWVQVLSYSPMSIFLAVGSHDNNIYIYEVATHYRLFYTLRGHNEAIASIDWSVDEAFIKSCTIDGELFIWDVQCEATIDQLNPRVIHEKWASWTSSVGWSVRGINQLTENADFITSVSRSPDNKLVAVGNNWGLIELYAYPNGPEARASLYRAHSLDITTIAWLPKNAGLLTAGGHDLTFMQWKIDGPGGKP